MTVVLGAGLAGLSAGYILSKSGIRVTVIEKGSCVGGLARTVCHNGFRFDLGGHRFLTKDLQIGHFINDLLKEDLLAAQRKSRIFMSNRYFDYPLKPLNAIFGLGLLNTTSILYDYLKEKARGLITSPDLISLEDWVVNQFGRRMFEIYFRQYSEKVWGMDCSRISSEWVAQRIKGLSLQEAVLNAFFRFSGKDILTLTDSFFYPKMGIGQISTTLAMGIEEENNLLTNTKVLQINHKDYNVRSISVMNSKDIYDVEGREFVSSIPLPDLINSLHPSAPDKVLEAASRLKFRDLIIVTIMLDRQRVSDLTWLYLPEKEVLIGRIHEPKNWSGRMAPDGYTHLVSEYFCFRGDSMWNKSDTELIDLTIKQLRSLSLIRGDEVMDASVLRVPDAYPLLTVGYSRPYQKVLDYLNSFNNLHIIGRTGMFRYYNMDQAIETGMTAANHLVHKLRGVAAPDRYITDSPVYSLSETAYCN